MSKNLFGEMFVKLRGRTELTLRQFCKDMHLDAGNWSRVERGLATPPVDEQFYQKIVKLLDINQQEHDELLSYARAAKILPKELQDSDLMEHMPVMLRKIDGQKLKQEEIEKLISWIKDVATSEASNK